MHIPPGFLKPQVWAPLSVFSAAGVAYALKQTDRTVEDQRVPLMGVMAAFVFAAQMINFPVFAGTSGHVLGAALATAVLGMWPAMVVMTAVVIVQAFLFQDGGIDALGANVANMCIWGCLSSGAVLAFGGRVHSSRWYLMAALAGWLSVVGSAVLCAFELALSGTSPLQAVLPAMTGIHAVIGVFEGSITIIALRFIRTLIPGTGTEMVGGRR